MTRYDWKSLNHQQVGKYCEYFVKMEFTMCGFDVYSSEVDDRGIDFIFRVDQDTYYDVQVKSVRGLNYIFFRKQFFNPRQNLLASIVILNQGEPPTHYLIPSLEWNQPNQLLVSHDYEGLASKPEWGINLSMRNMPLLEQYAFDKVVKEFLAMNI